MSDAADHSITQQVMLLHNGDSEQLKRLIADHLPWIEARVRKRLSPAVRQEGDTQDFVQDALVEVLRDGPRFAADSPEAFRALLARIVENTLIDRHRYMHREQRDRRKQCSLPSGSVVMLNGAAKAITSPATKVEREEQHTWLRLALEMLGPDDREAVRLRDWEGLSFGEAGKQLGISDEAMRLRYRRALPRLAKKLDELRRGNWQTSVEDA
ncbi:MAG: RNA polymerase sigma-70 factor (ECF subfamily) [Planctomycetota bacterium]|jgi:RNA polymerase sigma-70 factor (ECF subfamily)